MTVRVAAFNCKNLFARFKFKAGIDPEQAVQGGWKAEDQAFSALDPDSGRITGDAMQACDADVFALQEVEGLDTRTLPIGPAWRLRAACVDGNDPRARVPKPPTN